MPVIVADYDDAYLCSLQGILRLRGRPTVAYDQQGLVFAVAMEGGAIKLFDSRSYDKVVIFCNELLLLNRCFGVQSIDRIVLWYLFHLAGTL